MDFYRVILNGTDVTSVNEDVEAAVKDEERRTSCDYVHPQYDVHHPGGHPENSVL